MIFDVSQQVKTQLSARKFPYRVSYGLERVKRDGYQSAIVFERDREAGDVIGAPIGANRLPNVPMSCMTSGKATIYVRSSKPGAASGEHEDEADRVRDGVLCALYNVAKAASLPLEIVSSAIVEATDVQQGATPGLAVVLRFKIGSQVRDVSYTGAGPLTGVVADVYAPLITSDDYPDFDPVRVSTFGSIVLPMLQLAGSFTVRVGVAGSFSLPLLQLAGAITPRPSVGGSIVLPMLQLAGSFTVRVGVAGSFSLPLLTLAGSITPFYPTQLTELILWLQNDTVGTITTVPDIVNPSDPAGHTVAAQKPTGNSDKSIQFLTNDALLLPIGVATQAGIGARTALGLAFRFDCDDDGSTGQYLFTIRDGTNGASARKFAVRRDLRTLVFLIYTSGTNGRQGVTAANSLAIGENYVEVFYDHLAGPTDNDKMLIWINGVSQNPISLFQDLGAGGGFGAMPAVTGNAVIGSLNGDGSAGAYSGLICRNFYGWGALPSATNRAKLRSYPKNG